MKNLSRLNLQLFLILLTYLSLSWSYTFDGYQIRDLEYDGVDFIPEAVAWKAPAGKIKYGTRVGSCSGHSLMGGYKTVDALTTFTRIYDNLPTHNTIFFTIHIWLIDSWDNGDYATLQFDTTQLNLWNSLLHTSYSSAFQVNYCGAKYSDIPNIQISGQVAHDLPSLTVQVISGLDFDTMDESIGFRDFTLLFATTPSTTNSYCGNMPLPGQQYTCRCSPGQYPDINNNCQDCGPSCQSCFGASSSECYTCKTGYFYDGTECKKCDISCDGCFGATSTKCDACKTGYFYDGTSCEKCDESCNGCTGSTSANCNACKNGYFYNGAYCQQCDDSCDGCSGPSSADCDTCKSDYYFDNGAYCEACHSSCKTCYGNSNEECSACRTGYSLFLDTICTDSCPAWFTKTSDANTEYCNAVCPNNGVMYTDYTCTNRCNIPYKVIRKGRYKFCVKICSDSEYFHLPTLSCVSPCPLHYYGDDSTLMCEACQDSLCEKCSGNSGQICSQCQEGAILDNDGICKKCEAMVIKFLQSDDADSQYSVTLSPETCDLTLSYVKTNLLPTESSKKKFPASFTLKTSQSTTENSRTYLLTITIKDTLLEPTDLAFTLNFLSDTATVPKRFIPSPTLEAIAEATPAAAAALTGTFGASFAGTLSLGASAALWSMINYQQFIGNLIFVNTDYPVQLELFLSLLQSVGLEMLPNPLMKLSNKIDESFPQFKGDINEEKYNPPPKFVKYEKTSFFIENGGTSFAMNFCLLALMGLIPLLLKLRRFPGRSHLSRLLFHLRWNINARAFLENGIPIALAFCLQIRKMTFDNPYSVISMTFAFMAFFYFIIMADFLLSFLGSKDTSRLQGVFTKARLGTLYEGVKLQNPIGKYYHFFILFRGVILAFLVVFLEEFPVFQVLPLVFYNVILTYFLFKGIEFHDKRLLYINRLKEICITIGLCGIIFLNVRSASAKYYDILGWVIVSAFIISFLTEFFYTIILQVMELKSLYQKLRAHGKDTKVKRLSVPRLQRAIETQNSLIFLTSENENMILNLETVDSKRNISPFKRQKLSSSSLYLKEETEPQKVDTKEVIDEAKIVQERISAEKVDIKEGIGETKIVQEKISADSETEPEKVSTIEAIDEVKIVQERMTAKVDIKEGIDETKVVQERISVDSDVWFSTWAGASSD